MKKIVKNISRILCSLLLLFSIFSVVNVLASEVIFQITKIEVKEKSDKVTVNDVSLSGGSITNDIVFTDKDDYITYNITIKNNTEDDYTIKSISDDNTSTYLKYTYDDLSNVKVESGKEKTFNMTITYIQETPNLTITDKAVSLTLTYEKEDGTTGTETITNPDNNATSNNGEIKGASETITNPKTGDNITIYIILGLISVTGLVITSVSKKHLSKSLMAVAIASSVLLPLGVKADSDKFQISFATNKIQNSYSELIPGIDFNLAVAKLSSQNDNLETICENENVNERYCYIINNNYTEDDNEYYFANENTESIKRASLNQFKQVKDSLNNNNIVSSNNSTTPVYIWFDNGIIYYYSFANVIYMNADSSFLFSEFYNINDIDLSSFDTSNVTNMSNMFSGSTIKEIDLSSFDTSKVTNMSSMFSYCEEIEEIDLSSFDTSKVTNMSDMFSYMLGIEEIDLSSFDTSNVTNVNSMFFECKVNTIFVNETFDVSNVTDDFAMFSGAINLRGEKGTVYEVEWISNNEYIPKHINKEYARIDDPDNGRPGYFTLKQN